LAQKTRKVAYSVSQKQLESGVFACLKTHLIVNWYTLIQSLDRSTLFSCVPANTCFF